MIPKNGSSLPDHLLADSQPRQHEQRGRARSRCLWSGALLSHTAPIKATKVSGRGFDPQMDLCCAGDLHHELRPGVRRPRELRRHLPRHPVVCRDPEDCRDATKEWGGDEEPAGEGKRAESLLHNLVKLVNKDIALLIRDPGDGRDTTSLTVGIGITCTWSSYTDRGNVPASCRASSAPCRGRDPPASECNQC